MPNDSTPKPTPAATKPAVHHSTFAEGESHPADHPEEEHIGTFAEGECEPGAPPRKNTSARSPKAKPESEAQPEAQTRRCDRRDGPSRSDRKPQNHPW